MKRKEKKRWRRKERRWTERGSRVQANPNRDAQPPRDSQLTGEFSMELI